MVKVRIKKECLGMHHRKLGRLLDQTYDVPKEWVTDESPFEEVTEVTTKPRGKKPQKEDKETE